MLIISQGLNKDGCSSCQTRVNNGLLAKLLLRNAIKLYRGAISSLVPAEQQMNFDLESQLRNKSTSYPKFKH